MQVTFHLPDEVALPRVSLVSVPYALKAADVETIGGLPPSAFVLAVPLTNGAAGATSGGQAALTASPALSGGGTADFVPLWTNSSGVLGNSALFQSGTGSTAKIGMNTTTPASTLDVKGVATVRGTLALPATGTATAAGGKNSQPVNLAASAFNSGTSSATTQNFRLQAEPTGNNTSSTGGTLNLLFASGTPQTRKPTKLGLLGRQHEEYVRRAKAANFDLLKVSLTGDQVRGQNHELAARLDMSVAALRTAVHRLRLRYAELLREEIAAILADPGDVEGEIRFLLAALERA